MTFRQQISHNDVRAAIEEYPTDPDVVWVDYGNLTLAVTVIGPEVVVTMAGELPAGVNVRVGRANGGDVWSGHVA